MAEIFGALGLVMLLLSIVTACLEHPREAAIGAGLTAACFVVAYLLDPVLSPLL